MTTAILTKTVAGVGSRREDGGWAGVATHSHMLRVHNVDYEAAKKNLVAWAREKNIGAVGVGSPWEPVSAHHYGHYERAERDQYFGGLVPPESVMDREAIGAVIDDLNACAGGRTLFYLDNETPKNRHGHLWYVGFEYQVPGWHDYSQDHRVQFWDGDPCEDPNAVTGGCHRRRSYAEVVACQRKAGALAIWAHPTSWWTHQEAFVTNIAAELILQLHADGFLDGMVVQGYDAYHRDYQALWFDLLDRGTCVPGYAELDACYDKLPIAASGTFLNYVPEGQGVRTVTAIVDEMRAAHHYVSSGPHLVMTVDGKPMGSHVVSGSGMRHHVTLIAWPAPGENGLSRVELLGRGRKTLAHVEGFAGGTLEFEVAGDDDGGYLVARVFGEYDNPAEPRQQAIRHCALTNPVYLDAKRTPKHLPIKTELTLVVAADSPACGAAISILSAGGDLVEKRGVIQAGETTFAVHPCSRLKVDYADGRVRDIPVSMANDAVRKHINYLADGLFRKDYAGLTPGEVPVAAFRFDEMRTALAQQRLVL